RRHPPPAAAVSAGAPRLLGAPERHRKPAGDLAADRSLSGKHLAELHGLQREIQDLALDRPLDRPGQIGPPADVDVAPDIGAVLREIHRDRHEHASGARAARPRTGDVGGRRALRGHLRLSRLSASGRHKTEYRQKPDRQHPHRGFLPTAPITKTPRDGYPTFVVWDERVIYRAGGPEMIERRPFGRTG